MTKRRPRIFSCPGCSLRITGLENECPGCKRRFGEDAELECPFCGTLVSPKLDHCPSCRIDYNEFADHAEEQLWQKALDKIVEEIEQLRTEDQAKPGAPRRVPEPRAPPQAPPEVRKGEQVLCPFCKEVLSSSDTVCSGCGTEFEVGEEAFDDSQAVCPLCGVTVSLDAPTCPSCGAEFEEEADEPEEPEEVLTVSGVPPRKAPETGVRATADERGGLIAKAPAAKAHAGSGISNGLSVTNGLGIVNGKGQTNGIQFVNGLGAVNGTDLINGSGVYNGTGSGRLQGRRRGKKTPIYMRWQIIAVLVAVAIIVPSYLQFSRSGDDGPYSIDGDFRDWEEVPMFTVTNVSPDVEPDVVEWSAATHADKVYLYVRMSQDLMAGLNAQRLVLFIDSDDSPSSGYHIGGIGADYMVELFGWNGSVKTSAISRYHHSEDQTNWTGWAAFGPVESRLADERLEAKARLTGELSQSAKLILTAQNEQTITCISYPIMISGGVLIVEQEAVVELLPADTAAEFLRLRFICQGEGGTVQSVAPVIVGASASGTVPSFSLDVGEEHEIVVPVDSSGLEPRQFVSAGLTADSIVSTFSCVNIIGAPARAYVASAPANISIDGAFADWTNLTVKDHDSVPVPNPNIDIDEVGAVSDVHDSFFYVSVQGQICAGVYIPKSCAVPVPSGSGGTIVTAKKTAEDMIRVYIDSDKSTASGRYVSTGSYTIGADYMVEVRGLCREIVSVTLNSYVSGAWVPISAQVDAAKDASRMEIGLSSSVIGGASEVAFIIETTDWSASTDMATDQAYDIVMRAWYVDSTSSASATQTSNQRKVFHDGTNFWSFYYDGTDTVYGYSTDGGESWETVGSVFTTAGVASVSIWYDSENDIVYATGDKGSSSRTVCVKRGTVDADTHAITWGNETTPIVSTSTQGNKNSFICKDVNGHLWIMATDKTGSSAYDLAVYKSDSTDDISSWTLSDRMLDTDSSASTLKGSLLPAGSGSDLWAVYNYDLKVAARTYTDGSWGSEEEIYSGAGTGLDFINTAPASALVDGDGVAHVVYGDGSKNGVAKPRICYANNESGWTSVTILDNTGGTIANSYPSISIDSSTDDLYVVWVQDDDNHNIICKKYSGGSWAFQSIGGQTTNEKQYLTSIYSVSSASNICWQWTQNKTGTIEVIFDKIPEFEDVVLPVLFMITIFAVISRRRRARTDDKG